MGFIDDFRAILLNLSARDVDAIHRNADTDLSRRALHHTLGNKGSQASPGNHTHDGNDAPKIPVENIIGFDDTGWVDCTLASGISMQSGSLPQVRRASGRVYLQWGVSGSGIAVNTGTTAFYLPSGFAPTDGWKYLAGVSSNAAASPFWVVHADGSVEVRTNTVGGTYYLVADGSSWFG